jgi:hypothetical protein
MSPRKDYAALPDHWWEHCSGIVRFTPKMDGKTITDIIGDLDDVKGWGFDAVEIFAPYQGGTEYSGLDVVDYYSVDASIGTMDDFKSLVEECHRRRLAIIIFVNLGYSAMDFPAFLKACDFVKAGFDSPEVHWFLWSDTGTEEFDRSLIPYFMNDADGNWHYSEKAGKYYWVKWRGDKGNVRLPQFNFGSSSWQAECKRVVKFWMDTEIDGMVVDAVNWYMNCNWLINNETITDIINSYGNKYIQPEGAGGFCDDPVKWITEGKYNSVQDYGLYVWWTGYDAVSEAIKSGNPRGIEYNLRRYRDRVVKAGGVTYQGPSWAWGRKSELTEPQKLLEMSIYATVGELFACSSSLMEMDWSHEYKTKLRKLLRVLQNCPALQAAGDRKRIMTNDDDKYYAFMRTTKDRQQKALIVMNFQQEAQTIKMRLGEEKCLKDVITGERAKSKPELELDVEPYGYRIFLVEN